MYTIYIYIHHRINHLISIPQLIHHLIQVLQLHLIPHIPRTKGALQGRSGALCSVAQGDEREELQKNNLRWPRGWGFPSQAGLRGFQKTSIDLLDRQVLHTDSI